VGGSTLNVLPVLRDPRADQDASLSPVDASLQHRAESMLERWVEGRRSVHLARIALIAL
jgi:hypothetical protein